MSSSWEPKGGGCAAAIQAARSGASVAVHLDVPALLPMLSYYHDLLVWSEEGRPKPETIRRLGLGAFEVPRL